MSQQHAWRSGASLFASGLAASLLSVHQVLLHAGWPANDDSLSWKHRTQMYLLHFEQGDWLPIWSTTDVFDQGSPLLAYYNKLFYTLSASLYWVLGGMKPAIVVATLCALLVGVFGTFRCLRSLRVPEPAAVCLACVLPLAGYTCSNWLVRGAFAELSAAMLVPWFLEWLLRWAKQERFGWSIVPLMILLYLAHAIIALYAVAVAVVALPIVFLPGTRTALAKGRELLVRGALASTCFLLAISPWLYVHHRVADLFSLADMKAAFPVHTQFRPLGEYLWGRGREMGLSVQLDPAVWLLALGGGLALGVLRVVRADPEATAPARASVGPGGREALVLALTLGFLLFMQTRWAAPVYAGVPGFDFIQFPWRLLAFVTPLAILLAGRVVVGLERQIPRAGFVAAVLCLGGTAAVSPLWSAVRREWIPAAEVEKDLVPSRDFIVMSGGEYLPALDLPWIRSLPEKIAYLHFLQARFSTANPGCRVTEIGPEAPERLEREFSVRCSGQTEVVLPLVYSGLERIWRVEPDARAPLDVRRTREDPRMRVVVPAGHSRLLVRLPSLGGLLGRRAPPVY